MGKVIIIAEAGVNHNGDIALAKRLIDVAADAGADYVKFQTFKADKLVSQQVEKADYQKKNINDGDDSQYNMLKKLELSEENHHLLIAYCKQKNIKFLSTAFDLESLDFLNQLGIEQYKIPSGEITNLPYLRKIVSFKKPIILSTGMCVLEEIAQAIQVFTNAGIDKKELTVLHCTTDYPTKMEDVNLNAMVNIKDKLGVSIGYSDHTLGIEVPIAAVALGAKVIEKHFTLDRTLPGPDHVASLEPEELKAMVSAIRNIEQALGSFQKKPSEQELKNRLVARKSIHINKNLSKGHTITEEDIIPLRPGDGISPMEWENIIGKKLNVDKKEFDKLLFSDLI